MVVSFGDDVVGINVKAMKVFFALFRSSHEGRRDFLETETCKTFEVPFSFSMVSMLEMTVRDVALC